MTSSKAIKLSSLSTQLTLTFFVLINVKLPTTVGILTFMSRKNSIIGVYKPKTADLFDSFILIIILKKMMLS